VSGGTYQGGGEYDVIVPNLNNGVPDIGSVDICFKDAGLGGNCTSARPK
jgi:hypothetical protein